MTAASPLTASIGRSLLIQMCVIEVLSIIFFIRIGASVLGGMIAPVWGVALPFVAFADSPVFLPRRRYLSQAASLCFFSRRRLSRGFTFIIAYQHMQH